MSDDTLVVSEHISVSVTYTIIFREKIILERLYKIYELQMYCVHKQVSAKKADGVRKVQQKNVHVIFNNYLVL